MEPQITEKEYFEQLNAALPAKCTNGAVLIQKWKCVDGKWKLFLESPTMQKSGPCDGCDKKRSWIFRWFFPDH
jgi:hypothetical protein